MRVKLEIRLTDLIIIALIVIIALGGYGFYKKLSLKTDNTTELLKSSEDKTVTVLNLSVKEFKEYRLKNDSLLNKIMDSLNVKPRNVKQVIKIDTHNRVDSIITIMQQIDSTNNWYNLVKPDSCTKIEQYIDVPNKKVITNYTKDEKISMLVYWKRNKILGLRIGRKVYSGAIEGECSDVKAESISIIKNNK